MLKEVEGIKSIEIPFTGGVNELAPTNKMSLSQCLKMENFRLSEDGTRVVKRLGLLELVSDFGEDVYCYTTYYDSSSNFCELAVLESKIKRKIGTGSWTTIHTFSSNISHPVTPISVHGKILIINEIDSRMIHTDGSVYQIGIDAPTSLPTLSAESGGNFIAGTYRYAVTFARSGNYGCESNPIKSLIGTATFTGSGLNDLSTGGSYTGSINRTIRVVITETGTPDKIKYSFDGGKFLFIADTLNHRLMKRNADDLSYILKVGQAGNGVGEYQNPSSLCSDGQHVYVCDYGNHRIVKLTADSLTYVASVGSYGSGDNQFNNPYGITTDGTHLYITDQKNHRIHKRLCSDLSLEALYGSSGSGNDQFDDPHGIHYKDGYLYIADRDNHRIKKHLASDLSYVTKIGSYGTGNDQFDMPRGIYCDGTYVYVCDSNNHRIHKRQASDLSYVSKIGSQGSGNDQFNDPRDITGDGTYLYIADMLNYRIQKRLASDLSFVSKIGSYGTGNDQFNLPHGAFFAEGPYSSDSLEIDTKMYLQYGIQINFSATTGHTLNDYWEFTCSACAITVSAGDKVSLSNIPISTDPQVNQRKIYRTTKDGAKFYWLATINNNTTTTFIDNFSDSALGYEMEEDKDVMPNGKLSVWWDNRLWVSGDDMIYYSEINTPEEFSLYSRYIDVRSGIMGDEITGLIDYKDTLYIFKRYSTFVVLRASDGSYGRYQLHKDIGFSAPWSILEVNGLLMGISDRGINLYNGLSLSSVSFSNEVARTLRTINTSKLDYICAVHNPRFNEVWFSIPYRTGGYSAITVVYNYATGDNWYFFSFHKTPSCLVRARDSSKKMGVYMGTQDGYLFLCDTSYRDGGTNIQATIKKPWISLPEHGIVRLLETECEIRANKTLTAKIYVDFKKSAERTANLSGVSLSANDIEERRVIYEKTELGQRAKSFSVEYINNEDTEDELKINSAKISFATRALKGKTYGD